MLDWLEILGKNIESKNKSNPIYIQISNRLRKLIEEKKLKTKDKLPADRELSSLLNLDRSTISKAYKKLEQEGYLESTVGKGTFVRNPSFLSSKISEKESNKIDFSPTNIQVQMQGKFLWHEKFSQFSQKINNFINNTPPTTPSFNEKISFSAGVPSLEFFPKEEFQSILNSFAKNANSEKLFSYTDAQGHPALQEEIIKLLASQNIKAKQEEILILSGSQQGIDLVARTFIDPGDLIAIEDPSYFWANCNFNATGAKTLPIPISKDGLNLNYLSQVLNSRQIKFLYVMPSFQNPSGSNMPFSKREELLQFAVQNQIPIFEDNFVGDLNYTNNNILSLKALDTYTQSVIYQSTLSKSLCPGLRIGWIIAPQEALEKLSLSKKVIDLSTNTLSQLILAEYLKAGLYQNHLALVRKEYSKRLEIFCACLNKYLAEELFWHKPEGGIFIWAKLPPGFSSRELLNIAEQEGVNFSPGDLFFSGSKTQEYLRLSFVQNDENKIEEGIKRLAKALKIYFTSKQKFKISNHTNSREGPNIFV